MHYQDKIEDVLLEFKTNQKGLSKAEVDKRIKKYGKNTIENENKVSKLALLLKQFQDSMIIMLLIVSVISFGYAYVSNESYTDAILIIAIVLLNVFMGYFQETKAEASLRSLKKGNNEKVKVKRDNKIIYTKVINLVPGDIIVLEAGDKIPADARIIEEVSAQVDESILTGESIPVSKNNDVITEVVALSEQKNMVFSGCNLTNGKLTAVVTATGMYTEIGKIAKNLTSKKEVPTPLQQKINDISKNLTIIVILIVILVFLYNLIFLKNDLFTIIMLCVSLMVSAVPEGLPAVISISLAVGINEIAKRKALVRTLSSVETLGATQIICSDKTGTITKNKMTVVKLYSDNNLTEDKINNDKMLYNMMLCNTVEENNNKLVGDPTETSLVEYIKEKHKDLYKIKNKYKRILEIPFDSNRKRMSVIYEINDEKLLLTKGSIEGILEKSNKILENNEIKELTAKKKKEILELANNLSKEALRVLSFAYSNIKEEYKKIDEDNLQELEKDLIFTGLVGIIDPPRDKVKESIQTCKEAGIIPVMITGDNLVTATAIAKNIGLIENETQAIEGKELAKYNDQQMKRIVKQYRVYARVSPEDKVRIVKAWQDNNKVVAMTGDGVNDAPAIKLAHIGIGMGKTGTEVTKSVADIILLDDCFNTIVDATEEGRRIYANIRNVILYTLSSNFAEIFIVLIGMFMGVNILLPIHILYIDLVTDALLSICMAFEKSGKSIMKEPPHKSSNKFFTPFMIAFLAISSIVESALIYFVYKVGLNNFGPEIARSMAFLCLIVQEMVFALNCKNLKEPLIKHGLFNNKYINICMILLTILQIAIFITPLRNIFDLVAITLPQAIFIIMTNLVVFIIFELIKPILTKKFSD